jgi:Family of unknown function (DUF5723)
MVKCKAWLIHIFVCATTVFNAQDINLLHLQGSMPGTFLNPGLSLDKTFNASLGGVQLLLGTDGPPINKLTSKNTLGERYIDVKKLSDELSDNHNIYFSNDIHTLDLGVKVGGIVVMAGHGFRSSANVRYPKGLVEVAAQGNAAFIGQQIQIGPAIDVLAYNELYLGLQKTLGNFTVGIKGKLLYGTASISTENSDIRFSTNPEFYQLELKNDYLIRSSALLRYNSLDSITLDYSGFSFDNLFYNNQGLAFDLGASFKLDEKITLSASALDIGSISWDFFPRKYTSKGTFTFEGLDIVKYLGDTTTISIGDTLLSKIDVTSGMEEYSTLLNGTFTLGGTYHLNPKWTFNALYLLRNDFGVRRHSFSASTMFKYSVFDLGVQLSVSKNNYSAVGLFGRLNLGPVSGYVSTENIAGLIRPFDSRSAAVRLGLTMQL